MKKGLVYNIDRLNLTSEEKGQLVKELREKAIRWRLDGDKVEKEVRNHGKK